jgi:pimeloyl-ACP methyl ester carboxylesterase
MHGFGRWCRAWIVIATAMAALSACSNNHPMNPSFPLTVKDAKEALREMEARPMPFERPVLILGGIHDPGLVSGGFARRLRRITDDQTPIISVAFFGANSFDACRDRVLRAVDRELASNHGDGRAIDEFEVDVIAISMGGLVARYAAIDRDDGEPHLKVRRMFTISTPHRGAMLATLPTLDPRQVDMRAGSAFLATLDRSLADAEYELLAYARLDDEIVGEMNTAPPGRQSWWVPNPPLTLSHLSAHADPRIIADIARRLRAEEPLTRFPPTPLPGNEETSEGS